MGMTQVMDMHGQTEGMLAKSTYIYIYIERENCLLFEGFKYRIYNDIYIYIY